MKKWIKWVLLLLVLAALVWLALNLSNGLLSLIGGADVNASEPDPMFAEEMETVTRPPELYAEETQKPHKTLDDYQAPDAAPVDKTASELIEEAKKGA